MTLIGLTHALTTIITIIIDRTDHTNYSASLPSLSHISTALPHLTQSFAVIRNPPPPSHRAFFFLIHSCCCLFLLTNHSILCSLTDRSLHLSFHFTGLRFTSDTYTPYIGRHIQPRPQLTLRSPPGFSIIPTSAAQIHSIDSLFLPLQLTHLFLFPLLIETAESHPSAAVLLSS